MRFSFEKNLEGYRDVARDVVSKDLSPEEEKALDGELEFKITRAVRNRDSGADTQRRVYDLQEQKQVVMKQLHEKLAALDHSESERVEGNSERTVRKSGNGYVAVGRNGQELPVTKGEIMTDMNWGIKYRLDDSVERKLRKQYLVESAKSELGELLDRQITLDEVGSARTNEWLTDAFVKREASTGYETGFLAEKMVKCFLTKLTYDHDVDFNVLDADAFDDVVRKVDFIVTRRKWERGVGVEESDETERVGVQFTTNTDPEMQRRKAAQVEQANARLREDDDIRDVVLVTMPTPSVRDVYNEWRENPQPGGPDKLWSDDIREQVFSGVMQQILSPQEIVDQWVSVTSPASEAAAAAHG